MVGEHVVEHLIGVHWSQKSELLKFQLKQSQISGHQEKTLFCNGQPMHVICQFQVVNFEICQFQVVNFGITERNLKIVKISAWN